VSKQDSPSATARAALWLIAGYRSLRTNQVSPCRFTPSCSTYAQEAIETQGFWRGGSLALRRILRCNPLGGHGVDLVPLKTGAER
jgi:putative membrane protein insertion efficiency factor